MFLSGAGGCQAHFLEGDFSWMSLDVTPCRTEQQMLFFPRRKTPNQNKTDLVHR